MAEIAGPPILDVQKPIEAGRDPISTEYGSLEHSGYVHSGFGAFLLMRRQASDGQIVRADGKDAYAVIGQLTDTISIAMQMNEVDTTPPYATWRTFETGQRMATISVPILYSPRLRAHRFHYTSYGADDGDAQPLQKWTTADKDKDATHSIMLAFQDQNSRRFVLYTKPPPITKYGEIVRAGFVDGLGVPVPYPDGITGFVFDALVQSVQIGLSMNDPMKANIDLLVTGPIWQDPITDYHKEDLA